MDDELRKIDKEFQEIKDKMGIRSYEVITAYCSTLWRKIEDLIEGRNKWREKALKFKFELQTYTNKKGDNAE